jgi:hypothetical protein
VNYLNGLTIYLCGAIDNYDRENWRDKYRQSFKNLGLKIYDPLIKPDWMCEQAHKKIEGKDAEAINDGDYSTIKTAGKEIHDVCLSMVSHSDIIFCYLPKVFTIGTIDEIHKADEWFKPIIFVFDGPGVQSLYAADLFYRHIVAGRFEMGIDFLKSMDEYGVEWLINNGIVDIDVMSRWLPLTHKAG